MGKPRKPRWLPYADSLITPGSNARQLFGEESDEQKKRQATLADRVAARDLRDFEHRVSEYCKVLPRDKYRELAAKFFKVPELNVTASMRETFKTNFHHRCYS